jgi:nucleoside-diphosphate-sugar epimerase
MKLVVTGGGGYIGTTLVPFLLEKGHFVTVIDRFFFGADVLQKHEKKSGGKLKLIRDDIRHFSGKLLEGHDAVVDMAALSNDPSGELDPWKTFEINYLGRSRVARLAKEAGIKRYLLISSCSIYGFQEGVLTEKSPVNPLTTYSKANYLAESDNLPLGDDQFTSSAIRFATVYGLSGRMRFDLAINGMTLGAFKTGKIPILRDGTQWRPMIHVKDAARAILTALEADPRTVNGQIYNMGSDEQNFQIKPLADAVASAMPKAPIVDWYGDPDHRSYRVSFAKAKSHGFQAQYTPMDAVKEMVAALQKKTVREGAVTKTVDWYKHLLNDPAEGAAVAFGGEVL